MLSRDKKACGLFGIFALSLLVIPSPAQTPGNQGQGNHQAPPAAPGQGAVGRIGAVGNGSITVALREGGSKTYAISSGATVTLDDQSATLASLAAGQFVMVNSADGTTTDAINAHTNLPPPPGGGPGGGPGGPPPPDGGPGGPPPPDGGPDGPPPA